MPFKDKEEYNAYMRRYRKMLKEAKQKRLELYGEDADSECVKFREQVLEWLQGKIRKTFKMAIEWDAHCCKCDTCAVWFAKNRRSPFKQGVNLFQKSKD